MYNWCSRQHLSAVGKKGKIIYLCIVFKTMCSNFKTCGKGKLKLRVRKPQIFYISIKVLNSKPRHELHLDLSIVVKNIVYKFQNIWPWKSEVRTWKLKTGWKKIFGSYRGIIYSILHQKRKIMSNRHPVNMDLYIPVRVASIPARYRYTCNR